MSWTLCLRPDPTRTGFEPRSLCKPPALGLVAAPKDLWSPLWRAMPRIPKFILMGVWCKAPRCPATPLT